MFWGCDVCGKEKKGVRIIQAYGMDTYACPECRGWPDEDDEDESEGVAMQEQPTVEQFSATANAYAAAKNAVATAYGDICEMPRDWDDLPMGLRFVLIDLYYLGRKSAVQTLLTPEPLPKGGTGGRA
jgi:hypothetical protein